MKIKARTNSGVALQATRGIFKQWQFATSVALNQTAKDFQEAQRRGMAQRFTLRRRTWAERSIKIRRGDFAKRDRLEVTIRVETPGDASRSDILAKFEGGGVKRPQGSRLAIPAEVKRTQAGVISKSLRPRALGFRDIAPGVAVGAKRTFMIRTPGGGGGIFQRTGRRASKRRKGESKRLASDLRSRQVRDENVKLLYSFAPKARIDRRLEFGETARSTMQRRFRTNFSEAFRDALSTAKVR